MFSDNVVGNLAFLLIVPPIVVQEMIRYRFTIWLRRKKPELWKKLGKPRGLGMRLIVLDGFRLDKYIFQRKFRSLDDPDGVHNGCLLYWAQWTTLIGMALGISVLLS